MTVAHIVSAGVLAAALAKQPMSTDLTIDISALASMPSRQYQAMVRETCDIWRPYGVSLIWIAAPGGGSLPLSERILTVVDSGHQFVGQRRADTPRLGAVMFEEGHVLAERLLIVSVGEVEDLVNEAPWASRRVGDWPPAFRQELVGRALGRVLSHEIGHYLLAWRTHTPKGLMRSDFRNDVLIDPDRRAFQLSSALVPRLHARLAQIRAGAETLARSQ